jgi:nitrile hydratase beta subunit
MNGVHDMGGMQDMGPLSYQKNEPVFHARWEGRTFAMMLAMAAWRKFSNFRYQLEVIPAADYLRMSYYEKWFTALIELSVGAGLVTREEVDRGKRARGSARGVAPLTAEQVPAMASRVAPAIPEGAPPRFNVGQRVRGRNMNPVGHTRLPRYARGKVGTVERDQGLSVLQDTAVLSMGRTPQHVYAVRFTARELWGEQASPLDSVSVDLWEDYLEPA